MTARDLAAGRWPEILPALVSIPLEAFDGRGRPCPICGGDDRFSFTKTGKPGRGHGRWRCRQCTPRGGDGFDLLMALKGWDFKEAAKAVEELLGVLPQAPYQPPAKPPSDPMPFIKRILAGARPVQAGDPVDRYLRNRGLYLPPTVLFYHPRLPYYDGTKLSGYHPALLAEVVAALGKRIGLHRTYLTQDGRKAEVPEPRKTMGAIKGGAVRLFPMAEHIGVAEGIETALAASQLYGLPVMAALNANNLEQFVPPPGVASITIYGDNDTSYTGQKAAYACAHRLRRDGFGVEVFIPEIPGSDFNDIVMGRDRGLESRSERPQ